jgi:hypothetical protein
MGKIRIRDLGIFIPDPISESLGNNIFGVKIVYRKSLLRIRKLYEPGSEMEKSGFAILLTGARIFERKNLFVVPPVNSPSMLRNEQESMASSTSSNLERKLCRVTSILLR